VNLRAGEPVTVSAETVLLVERAIEAWRLTGGGFDPTVLGAVLRAGYDVSFDDMPSEKSGSASSLIIGCTDIEIDGQTVRLPPCTGFDPGGSAGLAADIVIGELLAAGAEGAQVNLGGDLRVAGSNLSARRGRSPSTILRSTSRSRRRIARRRCRYLDNIASAVDRRRASAAPPDRPDDR
jgi:thiamine biosynthesis lipoprotein ApbE